MKRAHLMYFFALIAIVIILVVFSKNNLLKSPDEDEASNNPELPPIPCYCPISDDPFGAQEKVGQLAEGQPIFALITARYSITKPCPIMSYPISGTETCGRNECEAVLQKKDKSGLWNDVTEGVGVYCINKRDAYCPEPHTIGISPRMFNHEIKEDCATG